MRVAECGGCRTRWELPTARRCGVCNQRLRVGRSPWWRLRVIVALALTADLVIAVLLLDWSLR